MNSLIFLDYDGVLHPIEAHHSRLFESADDLNFLLLPYPAVRLILSTSWVEWFGYERAKSSLPEPLRSRVIGTTVQDGSPRAREIVAEVKRRNPIAWLAIDDNARDGWPIELENNRFDTDPRKGLACRRRRQSLQIRLREHFGTFSSI